MELPYAALHRICAPMLELRSELPEPHALAFAARRVEAECVAFVFVLRDLGKTAELSGFPELRAPALNDADARELLAAEVGVLLDEEVRDRVIAEAHGNPLALIKLQRGAGPVELAGGFGSPVALSLTGVLEESFAARAAELPEHAQRLLVLVRNERDCRPGVGLRCRADAG